MDAKGIQPQQQKDLVLGAFETLVQAERQGVLDPKFVAQVMWHAHEYAMQNGLARPAKFRDAMKLAEQANRIVQDHHAIERKLIQEKIEERRRKIGVKGTDRVIDIVNACRNES